MTTTTRTSGPTTPGPKARSPVSASRRDERSGHFEPRPKIGRGKWIIVLAGLVALPLSLAPGCLQPGEFENEEQYRLKSDAELPDTGVDPEDSSSGGSAGSGGAGGSGGADGSGGSSDSGGSGGSGGSAGSGGARDSGQDNNQPPMGTTVSLEAESGMGINAPMMSTDDATASGGKYISSNHGVTPTGMPDAATMMGVVTYTFSVTRMGSFKVFGRVRAPVDANDSFWVKMDQGAWIQWNNLMHSPDWVWDDVHDTGMAGTTVTFMLSQGMHTFSVAPREEMTALDKLVITSDPNLMPTGMGP